MPYRHFPTTIEGEGIWEPLGGINLFDNVLKMSSNECVFLQEMLYNRNTPIKRFPFTQHSTEDWSAETPFRGATEYIDADDSARILFATENGKIVEYVNDSSSTDRVTGLSTGADVNFSSAIGRVIAANGSDDPRVGEKTTWRQFGAAPSIGDLATAASGSGSFTGTWLHIVIPVKEIDSNTAEIYGDWSNITTTTAASDAQFDLTWTDVVDTRVDKYWVFRTKDATSGPFFRVDRVNTSVQAYTDTTTDANLSAIKSPLLGVWGEAPQSKYVAYSGNRVAMAHITDTADQENAFQLSQIMANTYDGEAFPTEGHTIFCPGPGSLTGVKAIGNTGEDIRKNHLFVGQSTSCYILPETDPKQRLIEVSGEIGLINHRAIAQWGSYIFWVDKKKGLVFWQVGQNSPWEIGSKINPIFFGGGSESLTANQGDANITLSVWEDQLLITIRDDTSYTGGKKVYLMDLNAFVPADQPTANATARFSGPWTGPGFALMLPTADRGLYSFDNENEEILVYDSTETQDYIGGTSTNVQPLILTAPFLKGDYNAIKDPKYLYVYHFSNSSPSAQLIGEFDRIISNVTLSPINYDFTWDDLTWDDLSWALDSWQAEGAVDWNAQGKWFQLKLTKNDQDQNYAFFGFSLKYTSKKGIVTYS